MKNPFEKPKEPQQPRQLTQKDFDYERIFTESDELKASPFDRVRSLATPVRAAIIGGLIVFLIVVTVIRHQFDPPGSPGDEVSLEVPAGATTSDVLAQLAEQDVINSAFAMRLWMRIERGGSDQFQAGEYTFHKNTAVGGALAVLRSGPDSLTESIVIPEGETVDEIAERIGRLPGMTANRFRELAGLTGTPSSVRSGLQPTNQTSLEGFLFPDTYFIDSSDTEETMLSRMVNRFDTVARQTGLDQAERAIQRSPYDALILASMVESEAQIDQDRGKISQVIQNRLVQDMPLQIDATLIYGLGGNRTGVSLKDTRTPSPYNSYINKNLPPTPISNPGTASIEAALAPTPGPWLFYVRTEANGGHTFAVTGEEHERNVAIASRERLRRIVNEWPSGATRVAGVIGDPVRYSLSPLIHNVAYREMGVDIVYVALPVTAEHLASALDALRHLDMVGASVTIPHKEAVAHSVDGLSAEARALDAVNCIVVGEGGRMFGHNTDGEGFVSSLIEADFEVAGSRCAVVGAGGAARAVIAALAAHGAESVGVINRSPDRARSAALMAKGKGSVVGLEQIPQFDLVVNATPVGMNSSQTPVHAKLLTSAQTVADLVYKPLDTELLQQARAVGAKTVRGTGMLLHQAAAQIRLWTGHDAPVEAMRRALEDANR